MTKVLILDGQGGNIGRQLAERLVPYGELSLTVVGTNAAATSNMMKSGVTAAATGENPIVVNARLADVIVGPIGMVIADAMLGEVTPAAALAVGQSQAAKVLLPVNRCGSFVVGVRDVPLSVLIGEAVEEVLRLSHIG